MKLGDFYEKTPVSRPKNTQVFDLNNAHKEAILEGKIADLESKIVEIDGINAEKSQLRQLLEAKMESNEELLVEKGQLQDRIDRLDAEVVEKHRIFEEMAIMKGNFDEMSAGWGEMQANLSDMHDRNEAQAAELDQLRTNNANLHIKVDSDYNNNRNKEELTKELRSALEKLQVEHQALTEFSNDLSTKYTEASDMWAKLDKESLSLNSQVAMLTSHKHELERTLHMKNQSGSTDGENRVRAELNKQMDEMLDDMKLLAQDNKHLKQELSAPKPMSVGAIARQEGFKMPLASSAVNYRKNTLGNSKPTLLKFAHKELTDDN